MAVRPEDVAPDAVFTQTPPAPATPQPDGRDRSTWNGWPSRNTAEPRVIVDDQQRITRIRTPVMELEGHMMPTHLFYVVQHFAVPEPIRSEDWHMTIAGEVHHALTLTYDDLRRMPARTVRTVMECSGSEANMSRATDEVGRVEPQTPRYNFMRKNFSAIVATDLTVV